MGVSGRYKLVALLAVVLVATTAPAAATSPSLRATVQALRAVNAFRESVQPSSTSPGIRGSWSQKGIDYAREIAVGIISASVKKVTLPDIKFDKDSISGEITNLVCDDFKVLSSKSTLEAGTGIALGASIAVSCSADWNYRENIWPHIPHGSGSVDLATSSSSLDVSIGVITVDQKPNVKALSCAANVDITTLDFHGGLTGDILNLFKGLIKDHIHSAMDTDLCNTFDSVVSGAFNKVLDSFTYSLMLDLPGAFNISTAKFGLMDTPVVASDYVGVNLQGEVVNRDHPATPPFSPNPLPTFDASDADHMLQLYISRYVFNTGAWVFFEAGLEKIVITPAMVPSSFPFKLNTSDPTFSSIAPGMAQKYPDTGVELLFASTSYPSVNGNTSVANLTAPVSISFAAATSPSPSFAFELACTIVGGLTADIQGQLLIGQLTELQCPLTLVKSDVGTVDVAGLSLLVSSVLNSVALPAANKILAKGFPIPTLEGVEFVNSQLNFGDGYVELATDLKFDTLEQLMA